MELITAIYGPRHSPQTRQGLYDKLRPIATAFTRRWSAYRKRRAWVAQRVAKARALTAEGKLDDARRLLTASLSPVSPGQRAAAKRASVEVRDGEVPAIDYLFEVLAAQRGRTMTVDGTLAALAARWTRRRVGADRTAEMWRWIASSPARSALRGLAAADDSGALKRALAATARRGADGPTETAKLLAQSGLDRRLIMRIRAQLSHPWPAVFSRYRAVVASFETRWKPYAGRRSEVAAAVARARALVAGRKLAAARSVLEQVISKTAPARRGYVETIDAEVDAIVALERVLVAQHDYAALVRLEPLLWQRRRVGGVDVEASAALVRAFGRSHGRPYRGRGGQKLVSALIKRYASHGISSGNYHFKGRVRRGRWMVLHVPQKGPRRARYKLELSPNRIRLDSRETHFDRRCVQTNRVDRIDSSGHVWYRKRCTYTPRKRHYTVSARLAEPLPAWVKSQRPRWLHILGKLRTDGPHWRLTRAVVLDRRYRRR